MTTDIEMILNAVERVTGFSRKEFTKPDRRQELVDIRAVVTILLDEKEFTEKRIGEILGNGKPLDHSTISHYRKEFRDRPRTLALLKQTRAAMEEELSADGLWSYKDTRDMRIYTAPGGFLVRFWNGNRLSDSATFVSGACETS